MEETIFVNIIKMNQSKAKYSELIHHPVCLEFISKDFLVVNKKQTVLNGYMYDFVVDYGSIIELLLTKPMVFVIVLIAFTCIFLK